MGWHALSTLLARTPVVKHPANTSLTSKPPRRLLLLVASRSPIDLDLAQLLSVRSADSRSPPSSSSASFPSRDLSVRSLPSSRTPGDSNPLPSLPSKRLL